MENYEISDILNDASRLMELHGINEFKVKSIRNAAFQIGRLQDPLTSMSVDEMAALKGIGKSTATKIDEILKTGKLSEAQTLMEQTPEGVLEIMSIKGIGPKKTATIWKELHIESPGELLYACNENRLVELKGFGLKTQDQIRTAIEFAQSNRGLFHFAALEQRALRLVDFIGSIDKVEKVSLTGEIRRKCEVISRIEILVATSDISQVSELITTAEEFKGTTNHTDTGQIEITSDDGVRILIYFTPPEQFAKRLFITTGTPEHLEQTGLISVVETSEIFSDEKDIYQRAGLPFFEPETREGREEVSFYRSHGVPELIELKHLRGCLHNHSTYSDGLNSIREMANECISLGLEYFGICDHSKSAFYANGLQPDRVALQHQEIDELNRDLAPFRIFKGIESDILSDGSLDYDDDVLASFDFVVASVHSNLKMDEKKATERLIKAVSNPFTTILGHPTGRLLLARKGYPVNHREVIDACAHYGVAIELNAHPYRLDLDWRFIRYAMEKNVLISINPDAHQVSGIHDMHYGVCVARKGLLTKAYTLNALSLSEIETWFQAKKN